MTVETWNLSGSVSFRAKQKGELPVLADRAETMLMDLCLYAANKYPEFNFEAHPVNICQKLSERLK